MSHILLRDFCFSLLHHTSEGTTTTAAMESQERQSNNNANMVASPQRTSGSGATSIASRYLSAISACGAMSDSISMLSSSTKQQTRSSSSPNKEDHYLNLSSARSTPSKGTATTAAESSSSDYSFSAWSLSSFEQQSTGDKNKKNHSSRSVTPEKTRQQGSSTFTSTPLTPTKRLQMALQEQFEKSFHCGADVSAAVAASPARAGRGRREQQPYAMTRSRQHVSTPSSSATSGNHRYQSPSPDHQSCLDEEASSLPRRQQQEEDDGDDYDLMSDAAAPTEIMTNRTTDMLVLNMLQRQQQHQPHQDQAGSSETKMRDNHHRPETTPPTDSENTHPHNAQPDRYENSDNDIIRTDDSETSSGWTPISYSPQQEMPLFSSDHVNFSFESQSPIRKQVFDKKDRDQVKEVLPTVAQAERERQLEVLRHPDVTTPSPGHYYDEGHFAESETNNSKVHSRAQKTKISAATPRKHRWMASPVNTQEEGSDDDYNFNLSLEKTPEQSSIEKTKQDQRPKRDSSILEKIKAFDKTASAPPTMTLRKSWHPDSSSAPSTFKKEIQNETRDSVPYQPEDDDDDDDYSLKSIETNNTGGGSVRILRGHFEAKLEQDHDDFPLEDDDEGSFKSLQEKFEKKPKKITAARKDNNISKLRNMFEAKFEENSKKKVWQHRTSTGSIPWKRPKTTPGEVVIKSDIPIATPLPTQKDRDLSLQKSNIQRKTDSGNEIYQFSIPKKSIVVKRPPVENKSTIPSHPKVKVTMVSKETKPSSGNGPDSYISLSSEKEALQSRLPSAAVTPEASSQRVPSQSQARSIEYEEDFDFPELPELVATSHPDYQAVMEARHAMLMYRNRALQDRKLSQQAASGMGGNLSPPRKYVKPTTPPRPAYTPPGSIGFFGKTHPSTVSSGSHDLSTKPAASRMDHRSNNDEGYYSLNGSRQPQATKPAVLDEEALKNAPWRRSKGKAAPGESLIASVSSSFAHAAQTSPFMARLNAVRSSRLRRRARYARQNEI